MLTLSEIKNRLYKVSTMLRALATLSVLLFATTAYSQQRVTTMQFVTTQVRTFCPCENCNCPVCDCVKCPNGVCPAKPKQVVKAPTKTTSFVLKRTAWDNRRWTFPGTITNHLQGAPHYVPSSVVASLSLADRLVLHNQLHGAERYGGYPNERFSTLYPEYANGVGTTIKTTKATSAPVVRSGCPGGVCPTGGTTVRRRWRWFR